MPWSIRQRSSPVITAIMTGITPVLQARTTLVGSLKRRSTTHVRQGGVCQTAAATACGARPVLMTRVTIVRTRACSSAQASVLLPLGTPLLVLATAMMGRCTVSASATIGQLLRMVTMRASFTSSTMATSTLGAATTVQAGGLFGASKNNSD